MQDDENMKFTSVKVKFEKWSIFFSEKKNNEMITLVVLTLIFANLETSHECLLTLRLF